MHPAHSGPHHLAVLVDDLGRAETFYTAVLGLPVLRRWPLPDGGTRSVWLDAGGLILMLERSEQPGRRAAKGPGWHLFALRIDAADRRRWRDHLEKHGVAITDETEKTLYFDDPEGNRLGLSHWRDAAT